MSDLATLVIGVDSTAVKRADKDLDAFASTGEKAEQAVLKMGKALAGLVGIAAIAALVRESTTLASRYETLGAVMGVVGNNAGYTRAQMAGFEEELTKTGISLIGARDVMTMMAGAQMDLAKSSQMARIAQDAAVIGNINSSEAFQRMVQGIRSGETEILRTIGISVNFEQAYQKLALTLKKTSKDLTDLEKLTARQSAVMEYGSKIAGAYEASMGTAGKQLLSMQRYAEDLKVIFGSLFSDAFGTVVQTLNQALADTKKWLTENAEAAAIMKQNLGSAAENFVGMVKDVLGAASGVSSFNEGLSVAEILTGGLALTMAGMRDSVTMTLGVFQYYVGGIVQGLTSAHSWLVRIFEAQPPEWFSTVMDKIGMAGAAMHQSGVKNATTSNIGQFYGGKPRNLFAEVDEDNARVAALKAEQERIALGNAGRASAEAKSLAEQSAAAAVAAHTAALQRKIDLMKWEADAYDKSADAASKHADAAIKDNLALQDFVDSLQPAVVEAKQMEKVTTELGWALAEQIVSQEEYNNLLSLAKAKYTEAGQAAEAYRKHIADGVKNDNASVNFSAMREDLEASKRAGLNLDLYRLKLQDIQAAELRFRAESGSTWAIIGDVVAQNAGTASDAMVSWMNNLDGVGHSWRTLGDTVRNVLRDMVIQMQRALIQQQLMQPLMQWAGLAIGGFGGGAASAGAGTSFGSWSTPSGITPGWQSAPSGGGGMAFSVPSMAQGKSSAAPVSSQITINISSDGQSQSKVSSNGANAMAQEIQRSVEPMVLQVIDKHMRPGGRFSPTSGGGIR